MPNTFAYLVLFSWPLVAVVLFAAQPPARALSLAVVLGYLLLPARAGVNFPMIPAITKGLVISLTAAVVVMLALRRQRQVAGSREAAAPAGRAAWIFRGLIALTLLTPFLTVLTNGEPVIAGPRYIAGIRLYDAVSLMVGAGIAILPFVLGMRVLGTPAAQAELLRVLVLAACAYALLVLFEVRMSPQLSRWVYGYFPHSWIQHIRGGGFRPVVFLHHGLWLGIFLSMAVLAACTLWRQALRDRVQTAPWLAATLWLAVTLVLSRNLGATALALMVAPVILFAPPRVQVLVAAVCAGVVLVYPTLRGAGLVPTGAILSVAESIDVDRAQSLQFRLDHEDALLARANRKPLAGWGTWGRNRVYDPETGADLSVTDGIWVITIGTFGWLGYLAQFGMLTGAALVLARRRATEIAPVTAGLAGVMAVAAIDLIPNATLTAVTWLAAGSLAGVAIRQTRATMPAGEPLGTRRDARWLPVSVDGPLRPVAAAGAAPAATWPSGTMHHRRSPRR